MKLGVQNNHLGGRILYRTLDPSTQKNGVVRIITWTKVVYKLDLSVVEILLSKVENWVKNRNFLKIGNFGQKSKIFVKN